MSIFFKLQTPKPVPGPVTKRVEFFFEVPFFIFLSFNFLNKILYFSSSSSKSKFLKTKLCATKSLITKSDLRLRLFKSCILLNLIWLLLNRTSSSSHGPATPIDICSLIMLCFFLYAEIISSKDLNSEHKKFSIRQISELIFF